MHMVCEHEKLLNAQWENLLVLNDWMGLSSPEYYPIIIITIAVMNVMYTFICSWVSDLAFLFGSHMLLLCNTLNPAPTAIHVHVRYEFGPQRK